MINCHKIRILVSENGQLINDTHEIKYKLHHVCQYFHASLEHILSPQIVPFPTCTSGKLNAAFKNNYKMYKKYKMVQQQNPNQTCVHCIAIHFSSLGQFSVINYTHRCITLWQWRPTTECWIHPKQRVSPMYILKQFNLDCLLKNDIKIIKINLDLIQFC